MHQVMLMSSKIGVCMDVSTWLCLCVGLYLGTGGGAQLSCVVCWCSSRCCSALAPTAARLSRPACRWPTSCPAPATPFAYLRIVELFFSYVVSLHSAPMDAVGAEAAHVEVVEHAAQRRLRLVRAAHRL